MKLYSARKKDIKLYNLLFPFWAMLFIPPVCIISLAGNIVIDSLILLLGMVILKVNDKKEFYIKHIVSVYFYGLLADFIGAFFMFLLYMLEIGYTAEELYVTIPGVAVAAVCIFIFDYFISFRKADVDKKARLKLSALFAILTAPYTFMIPLDLFLDLF